MKQGKTFILVCEVKWALGSITMNKASEDNGIPVVLFQTLKDDAVKVLHSICQKIWRTKQWPQDWKMSVSIPNPKKGNAKECSNYLISHANKVALEILRARLQQYMNRELPNVQSEFQRGRESDVKLLTFFGSWRKQGNNTYTSLTTLKPLTVGIPTNCGKCLKNRPYFPACSLFFFVAKLPENIM